MTASPLSPVGLDPRTNAFRPDLADARLKGSVEAARFAVGEEMCVAKPVAALRSAPADSARLGTEAIRGELVTMFDTNADGWSWVQLKGDRYVGWTPREALDDPHANPTHKVSAIRTFIFKEPDIKSTPLAALPLGAQVTVVGEAEDRNARYALLAGGGAIVWQHLAKLDAFESDWTAIAERFLGVPYLWGGKTSLGIDCSGLVQISLQACGIAAPRDSDMQEAALGKPLPLGNGWPPLLRGDLVFWKGHVGIMRDAELLLHANAHRMAVTIEPLAEAMGRIASRGEAVTSVRRIG
jgi:cell wall-associated NlpC family hydrolase